MADTYLDSSVVGFNHQDALDTKVDTYKRLNPILNPEYAPTFTADIANNLHATQMPGSQSIIPDTPKIDIGSAILSDDPFIKASAINALHRQGSGRIPEYNMDLGRTIESTTNENTDKFIGGQFGYSKLRDDEDFYYNNEYLKNGPIFRSVIKNPARFIARVAVPAVLKFGEGLGNVGAMITSIGSDNYWADIADNKLSNWLEGLETSYKNKVIPVYKQAGFDEKGFFSKLTDWSFWNDGVADGVAFMASAAVPGMGFAKLGTIGTFGEEFGALARAGSLAAKAGKLAGDVGLGSWAELSSWTFNTAMEASMEGAGVYKEMSKRLTDERSQGLNDLSDDDIKQRAGKLARNTTLGNFPILAVGNAFENTLFFKPFKNIEERGAIQLGKDFKASSRALDYVKGGVERSLDDAGLSRGVFYGKQLAEGFVFEGLWEENAQLALQRVNQQEDEGRGFWGQLGYQTKEAFFGESTKQSRETAENIGLGALIGMGAGPIMSKISGERQKIIKNTEDSITLANDARQRLFDVNDIYERDKDNAIVFENNEPKVDPAKLANKQKDMQAMQKDLSFANKQEYFDSKAVQARTQKALANYVRSLVRAGVEDIHDRFVNSSAANATLFGMDPGSVSEEASKFNTLAQQFEEHAKDVDTLNMGRKPKDMDDKTFLLASLGRKADIYAARSTNTIISNFIGDENSAMLKSLNSFRTLNNASLSDFPIDNLNTLIIQHKLNEDLMKDKSFKDLSDLQKEYYTNRSKQLLSDIDKYKADNALALVDIKESPNGFFTPTITKDGVTTDSKFDRTSAESQRNIANYNNVAHANAHMDTLFSDKDTGHENWIKWNNNALKQRLAAEAAKAAAKTANPVIPNKFRELVPGDFDKVTSLVAKMVFSKDPIFSKEELQLQANYADLIKEILPQYENVAENQRILSLGKQLSNLEAINSSIVTFIETNEKELGEAKIEIDILKEELAHVANKKRVDQKRIKAAIAALSEKVTEAEKKIDIAVNDLVVSKDTLREIEEQIADSTLRSTNDALAAMKEEGEFTEMRLKEAKGLLEQIKKALKTIISVFNKLFPELKIKKADKVLSDPALRDQYPQDIVSAYDEIALERNKEAEANKLIGELTALNNQIKTTYANNRALIVDTLAKTDKIFKDKYLDTTKAKPVKGDVDEETITKNLTGDKNAFPPGGRDSGGKDYEEEAGFDGSTYQRPLSSKFFTTTFPDYRSGGIEGLPQDVQNYFHFTDLVTNAKNEALLKKKLGKGVLRSIIVNRNNINKLSLTGLAKEKKKWFDIEDAAMTHMEVIAVIEDGGDLYYTDKDLNKLAKVGQALSATDDKKIISRSLRTVKFTPSEEEQYFGKKGKYTQAQKEEAILAATTWRKSLLDNAESDPKKAYDIILTRGVANKMKNQDGSRAENSVVGTLIASDKDIDEDTVVVFSNSDAVTMNDQSITVPAGRPFIYTNNGVHEQLHAANNMMLEDEQIDTVIQVIKEMLADHMSKVMARIQKSTTFPKDLKDEIEKAGGIDKLSDARKKAVFLKITADPSTKGTTLFNSNYTQFLSSVIYYGKRDTADNANQIYLKGAQLILGNSGNYIDITDPSAVSDPDLRAFLSTQFHNIRYFPQSKRSRQFIEYYLKDGKLESRTWPHYNNYLLQEKNPDGSKRNFIPITTSIKTEEQHKAEAGTSPYYTYNSRGMTIRTEDIPVIRKSTEVKGETPKAPAGPTSEGIAPFTELTGDPIKDMLAKKAMGMGPKKVDFAAMLQAKKDAAEGKTPKAAPKTPKAPAKPEVVETISEDIVDDDEGDITLSDEGAINIRGNEPSEEPDYNDSDSAFPGDDAFRVSQAGVFEMESDLDALIADIDRMIPQFPVQRLRNVIRGSNGIEAWGSFTGSAIRLYEMAEKGTGYHEVFEAVANRLLSDAEWRALSKEFLNRAGTFTDRQSQTVIAYKDATDYQIKEQLAEEFMAYKLGKWQPVAKQQRSYFKIMWDFIKSLFHNITTIEDVFSKIDAGKFANTTVASRNRFSGNNFREADGSSRLPGLSAEVRNDAFQGATASMFKYLFYSPGSISIFDSEGQTEETIYDNIKNDFRVTNNLLGNLIKTTKDATLKEKYSASSKYISYILENWRDFKNAHQLYLRPLKVKFEEADNTEAFKLNEDSTSNRNDYNNDVFATEGKNSASKSVRFLFGTLLKLNFAEKSMISLSVDNNDTIMSRDVLEDYKSKGQMTIDGKVVEKGANLELILKNGSTFKIGDDTYKFDKFFKGANTKIINDKVTGELATVKSTLFMQSLANYDHYMLQALEEFKGLNDFTRIKEKLEELAGIPQIEEITNLERRSIAIANMSPDKAIWTSMYSRLFGFSDKIDKESAYKLKLKFHNYLSKHSPTAYMSFTDGLIIESDKRSFFENTVRRMENSINTNSALFFGKRVANKVKKFVAIGQYNKSIALDTFSSKNHLGERMKLIKFLGLDEILTKDFMTSLADADLIQLNKRLLLIRNTLGKATPESLSLRSLDIEGYTSNLLSFINRKMPLGEARSQTMSITNEMRSNHIVQSYISRIVSEINNVATLDELKLKYPQLDKYWAEDSIMIARLFDEDGNRTSYQMSMGYMDGIKDKEEREGTTTAKLEFVDKYHQQFNASLVGLHYSLPADSETEWLFNMGKDFVEYQENLLAERGEDIVNQIFLPKLRSEINEAIAYTPGILFMDAIHESTGMPTGQSLRFFKNILASDPQLLTDIHNDIKKGTVKVDKIISSRNAKIRKAILAYLSKEVENTLSLMTSQDNRIITVDEDDQGNRDYTFANLNPAFIEKYSRSFSPEGGAIVMNDVQVRDLIAYQKLNSMIGFMEQFKLFFGDPAQYKDWEKRAKSLFGPVEQMYYDSDNEFNNYLNEEKNKISIDGEEVSLPKTDMFHYSFTDKLTSRTVDDFTVVNTETANDLRQVMSESDDQMALFIDKFIGEYEKTNETDGQSIGTIQFARHLLIKNGWRWTQEQENYFQYDGALMRNELSKTGRYTYTDDKLEDIDKKIIAYFREHPEEIDTTITPVKTLMPTHDENGNQTLLKHSIHFMSYQVSKEYELLDRYINMLQSKEDIFNFKSVQKVGLQTDDNGKITPYYSDPFTKNDLEAAGNTPQVFDLRTVGIQVETQGSKKGQTLGSQLTKLVNLNLFEDGIPVDFKMNDENEGERKDIWDSLSHEEKIERSENYAKVYGSRGSFTTLEDMKMKNTLDTFSKLGVRWQYVQSDGSFTYQIDDLSKIKDYIHNELRRLEVDDNTVNNIRLSDDYKSFENPAETLPSYTTITNLLWSMADKSVTSMKVNGKPYIQVSAAFFNKGSRQAAYFDKDTNKWVVLNTKEEFDQATAEGKQPVMTSSELQFYRLKRDENGKAIETLGMEVYLPHIYKDKINKKRKKLGLPELSDEELMKHLNANPKLLEGIGFRIPTQATSSLDFFVVKGFLNPIFGSAVVLPSGITTKGGGDFDVDKLNTYLNNFKLDKDGMPLYEEFSEGIEDEDFNNRYISYVRSLEKEYNVVRDRLNEEMGFDEIIQSNRDVVSGSKDIMQQTINSTERTYAEGYELFRELPSPIKQQYYEKEEELRADDSSGIEKALEYLAYTENWIKAFDNNTSLQLNNKIWSNKEKRYVGEETVTVSPQEALPTLQSLVDNYRTFVEEAGLSNELINEYLEIRKERGATNALMRKNFRLRVAMEVASSNGHQSLDQFKQLPLALQNTKGAVENRYFESIRNILKSPDMFPYLLSPNSAENIDRMRNLVQDALGNKKSKSKELDYSRFISTEYIAEKRNQFTKGKTDIGIFAVAMTNYANSQVTGISIFGDKVKGSTESFVFDDLNEGWIGMPFEDLNMQKVGEEWIISLSTHRDGDGRLVMDKLSGYINGAVDVAKDPAIVEMGMHSELAGVYTILERMRLRGETIAAFMFQPSIREFLREVILLDNKTYHGQSDYRFQKEIMEDLVEKYKPSKEFVYDRNYRFSDNLLLAAIEKGEKMKKNPSLQWTPEEKQQQYYALVTYLKAKLYGNHLLESIQSSNHDTSSIRNPHILVKKELMLQKSKTGSMIARVENGQAINGGEALRSGTFINTDINMLNQFNDLFSRIGLFALQRANPRLTLFEIAKKLFDAKGGFISDADFISGIRDFETAMIDSLANKVEIGNDEVSAPLYKYGKNFFKSKVQNNLKSTFEALKQKYPTRFKKNFFLANLEINSDASLGIDLMRLRNKPSSSDILTREQITEGMRQLGQYESKVNDPQFGTFYKEMSDLYKKIVYGAYLQFGIRYSRTSFLDLIPVAEFGEVNAPLSVTDITKPALQNIDNEDFAYLYEQVLRSNWWKKNLVDDRAQYSVHFIEPSEKDPNQLVLANQSTWRSGKSKPPAKLSQIFFGRVDENGDMKTHIHPMMRWAGYEEENTNYRSIWAKQPEIVGMPAVKPEFIEAYEKETGDGFVLAYRPIKQVYEKLKNGDFSFMFTQLYKKVGMEDRSMARTYTSPASRGKNSNGMKSILVMYKPINKYGARDYREMPALLENEDGSYTGPKSIINFPPFEEMSDSTLIGKINDERGMLRPIFAPTISGVTTELAPMTRPKNAASVVRSVKMQAAAIKLVEEGIKTTMVRNAAQNAQINVRKGVDTLRKIGDKMYILTTRGAITVQEAGGKEALLKSEGLAYEDIKDPVVKNFFDGMGKMFVFDIKPAPDNTIAPTDGPAIEPSC